MFPDNNINNEVSVKKNGVWALVMGILFIPLTLIVLFFGMMSGFIFDSPGSEKLWYLHVIFILFAVVHPLTCLVASISGFVYHFKNKYGTGARVNKLLIVVPAVYFLILIVVISVFIFIAMSAQRVYFNSL